MRLVILMGTQKSHFAYRLAWDNSFAERIPFLPLHRRDLVSAEEGNKTFVGDMKTRINWRKFEVMGEVVLGIQRSQKTPYPHLARFDEVTRLILDIKLSGDDEVCFLPAFKNREDLTENRICIHAVCRSSPPLAVTPDGRSLAGCGPNGTRERIMTTTEIQHAQECRLTRTMNVTIVGLMMYIHTTYIHTYTHTYIHFIVRYHVVSIPCYLIARPAIFEPRFLLGRVQYN